MSNQEDKNGEFVKGYVKVSKSQRCPRCGAGILAEDVVEVMNGQVQHVDCEKEDDSGQEKDREG